MGSATLVPGSTAAHTARAIGCRCSRVPAGGIQYSGLAAANREGPACASARATAGSGKNACQKWPSAIYTPVRVHVPRQHQVHLVLVQQVLQRVPAHIGMCSWSAR